MILGIGLGGFVDGIVLHQILQWHEMLSNKLPVDNLVNKSVNMFWDGIFHAFMLLVTLTGVILLWHVSRRKDINKSGYLLSGGMITGWAVFNIAEGVIDHQILDLHYVNQYSPDPEVWNYGFLLLSAILLIPGMLMIRKGKNDTRAADAGDRVL
ncbi:MAG: DUF2243 domain-containing protein [Sphingobacteriales bacterium]|nr:MAG: DUF2243 domain-containing protein [Sphingobacteriales bacterium]